MDSRWYIRKGSSFLASCPLTGRKVLGDEKRALRKAPEEKSNRYILLSEEYAKWTTQHCPFCPGNESNQLPEITRNKNWKFIDFISAEQLSSDWDTRAFSNLYKRYREESHGVKLIKESYLSSEVGKDHIKQLQSKLKDIGLIPEHYFFDPSHFVIVGTQNHFKENAVKKEDYETSATMELEQFNLELITAFHARELAYTLDPSLKYGGVYKNQGKDGGSTQNHEHIQVRCYEDSRLTEKFKKQIDTFQNNPGIMDTIVELAKNNGWVIDANRYATAFTVPWEEYPGVWVVYNEKEKNFNRMLYSQFFGFTEILQSTLQKFEALGDDQYNFGLFDSLSDTIVHPHAKIITRKKVRGGTDILFGPENHSKTPETFAKELREIKSEHRDRIQQLKSGN